MGYYSGKLMGMQAEAVSGIVTDGLKLYLDASNPASYPGSGTTWFDLSGNNNNGTMVNGVVPLSNAMRFDGVNDYVKGAVIVPNRTYSVSYWIYPKVNSDYNQIIILCEILDNVWGGFTSHTTSTSMLYAGITVTNRLNYTSAFYTLNKWQLHTFTFNNGAFKVYKNGVLITSSSLVNPGIVNLLYYKISTTNGYLNDFLVYNKPLTGDEVLHNFNATKSKYGL